MSSSSFAFFITLSRIPYSFASFALIQKSGKIDTDEMYSVFNMGLGMVMIVAPYYAESILTKLRRAGEHAQIVGRVVRGKRTVTIE